jgi:hypothetical protein
MHESANMRAIAIVSMMFLPGTFISVSLRVYEYDWGKYVLTRCRVFWARICSLKRHWDQIVTRALRFKPPLTGGFYL